MFLKKFQTTISTSSIFYILHQAGLTWKTLERRAIQIREKDIYRYFEELSSFKWGFTSLCFLDEVSFDNRGMLRNKGYGVKGERLIHHGEFIRKPRVSLLCFLGVSGISSFYDTEGTFTRKKFFECIKDFAKNREIQAYPGNLSVWIMDGARIHLDANIVKYLRSLGILPVFLPSYCPMYNPIEVIFGLCKRYMQKIYTQRDKLDVIIAQTLMKYTKFDCTNLFLKCGYRFNGTFDPRVGF